VISPNQIAYHNIKSQLLRDDPIYLCPAFREFEFRIAELAGQDGLNNFREGCRDKDPFPPSHRASDLRSRRHRSAPLNSSCPSAEANPS
jgi:hypothetical protein